MQNRIEGVVVLYNPDISVIDHIKSYINGLEHLYVIDNSTQNNPEIIFQLSVIPQCQYIRNEANEGIAHALNQGAEFAIASGAEWLLTMDQDSQFSNGDILKLIAFAEEQDAKKVGIVSPFHQTNVSVEPTTAVDEVVTIMTSGNLISLYAYQAISGFDEQYFIDAVDWDYCLRLNANNFKVLRFNDVHLVHNLGNATQHTSPTGKKITALNYNKVRRYYITRNKLIILSKYRKQYPIYCRNVFKSLFRDLRHVLLYEDGKGGKLWFMMKGLKDYITGKTGRLKT